MSHASILAWFVGLTALGLFLYEVTGHAHGAHLPVCALAIIVSAKSGIWPALAICLVAFIVFDLVWGVSTSALSASVFWGSVLGAIWVVKALEATTSVVSASPSPDAFAVQVDRGALRGRALVRQIQDRQMPSLLGWEVDRMIARGQLTPEDISLLSEIGRVVAEIRPAPLFRDLDPGDPERKVGAVVEAETYVRTPPIGQ